MYIINIFQEKVLLPIGDCITGQSVSNSLKFLRKSQKWSRQQIDDFQNEKLIYLINHSYNNVPYYHDLFDKLGLKPSDIKSKNDLYKIPILTKDIIKKEGIERFTAKNISKKNIIKASSSGSTGEPLCYYQSKESYSMNIAANLRGWNDMNYKIGDKYVKLSQNSRDNFIKRLQDKVTRNLYLSVNPLIEDNFKIILDSIEKYKPKIIRCYPDPLLFLARYKLLHNEYKHVPLAITTTGNTLHTYMRKEIEKAFHCKVFDAYSCEGNSCVFECPSHTCYHSAEEYGISEIIDEGGNIIKNGIGKLISTDLCNLAHPFIRYDTQDYVEIDDTPCICGREHLRINKILGRDNDVLIVPSGRRFIVHNFTGFFQTDSFGQDKAVDQFQIIYKISKVIMLFRLVVNSNFNDILKSSIIDYWKKETGVDVMIEIVDEIPLHSNNKRKFIIIEK